ncbi:MAG: hypothetical protein GY821_04275 [Gammaproteobacteria bacterium]|nr:hypothetical protein [Gammaproteobacteria bacterium]
MALILFVPPQKYLFLDIISAAELVSQQLCPPIATKFRSSVALSLKRTKSPSPNLSIAQMKALKSLKSDSSIIIAKADKGNATVLMNSVDYREKINNLLSDAATYQEIPLRTNSNPQTRVNSLGQELNNTLRDLLKINRISEEEKTSMMFHSGVPSRFYGLPKIHKPGIPLRPIVSAVNNFCDRMALELKRILRPLIGISPSFIKNSSHFVSKLKRLRNGAGHKMVSFDVVSLFTKVPINESCKIIERKLGSDPGLSQRTAMSPSTIAFLLKFVLQSCYFMANSKWYHQTEGAAMGGRLSPLVADLFMCEFEEKLLSLTQKKPLIWWRYVDDVFCIWPHTSQDLDNFLQEINLLHPSIKFTLELEQNASLPFLDVAVTRVQNAFITNVYRKPTHTNRYLHYSSHHALSTKLGILCTMKKRAKSICMKGELKSELSHLFNVFVNNGYPPQLIRSILYHRKPKFIRQASALSWSFPYCYGISEYLKKLSAKFGISTIFSSGPRLSSTLCKLKDELPKESQANVIYSLDCECGKHYIGQTNRPLHDRLMEHYRAIKKKDKNNPMAAHLSANLPCSPSNLDSKILAREPRLKKRLIKEGILIKINHDHVVNGNEGYEAADIWNLFSHTIMRDISM